MKREYKMKKDSNKIFTADEIRKYLDGKMTNAEMHALERAAMDDPFLLEAIEGYQQVQKDATLPALTQLRKHFASKNANTQQAKIIPLHRKNNNWMRAAAAVLIIATLSVLSYFAFFNSNKETAGTPPLAQNETPIQPGNQNANTTPVIKEQLGAKQDDSQTTTTVPEVAVPQANKQDIKNQAATKADVRIPESTRDIALQEKDVAVVPEKKDEAKDESAANFKAEAKANEKLSDFAKTNDAEIASNKLKETSAQKKSTPAPLPVDDISELNKMFIAQVVGTDNMPLPFANINVISDKFGTYADAKGNFRLISADSLVQVEIRSVGHKTKNILLKSEPGLKKIVLEEDQMAMQNVVGSANATAFNKQQLRGRFIKDSAENVEPADGWASYEAYIDNNIQVPEIVIDRNIKGAVEISFDVRKNGSISNAKVDKSLCNDCDEEALRVIKQGPQWKVKKGRRGKSKVKVQF